MLVTVDVITYAGLARSWTVEAIELQRDLYATWIKRVVDLVLALVLTVLTSPLLLLAVVLVKATSAGPVIYSQTRLGRNRRPFTIYKVRSMYHDCERLTGPLWSGENDPRVTSAGRFLRRTHLDEIPQLWNVVRGEMSLVGPRPERPEMIARLERVIPRYAERLSMAPGLTGLAQVNLPPDSDPESVRRKLVYDLFYAERAGLWLDARIILSTGLFLAGVPFASSAPILGLCPAELEEHGARALKMEPSPVGAEA